MNNTNDYGFELLEPPEPCSDPDCLELTWLRVTLPDGASGPLCASHYLDGGTDDPEPQEGRDRAHRQLAEDVRRVFGDRRRR